MSNAQHCHDLSDRQWAPIEPHLPGRAGQWGGVAHDNRRFVNAVLWVLRTGAPWRDLPPSYGDWKNTHRRFCRWRDRGIWEELLDVLIDEPDYEWLMIDASHCKVQASAAGAGGGNDGVGRTKGGFNTKLHLAVDAHGMPLRILATKGTEADCAQADELIDGFEVEHLIADKGYDSNAIVQQAQAQAMQAQIPSRAPRKTPRPIDDALYRHRHLVENAFETLKPWRGIATRYAKRLSSFLAQAQIACLCLWLKIS
ncbi:MAG: IS5 family transposase [Salinisphaera sp.]